jgi:hypothetical protein
MEKKSKRSVEYPTMSKAATYRIRVQGRLDPGLSDRLGGMYIENLVRGDGTVESLLEGRLSDQAALTGVLNTLYELHLPVISADCIGGSEQEPV